MKLDLHIHSKYSNDSLMEPKKIIKFAQNKGLDGIAVTDHNTIKGGVISYKENTEEEFIIIIGSEIRTEYGDIIGLFLNEEIKNTRFVEVIDEIKEQDGISILAHPYRNYNYPEEIVKNVDLVEIFNARSKKIWNHKSLQLAKKFKKPISAGSDSHMYFEIGGGVLNVNEINNILSNQSTAYGKESNYYFVHGLSVIIEKLYKIL